MPLTTAGSCSAALVALALCLDGHNHVLLTQQPAASHPSDNTGLKPFEAALAKYVAVRRGISAELPPLTVTEKPAEIIEKSDALARAIQRSRQGARQGEFFPAGVAAVLRERMQRVARDGTLDDVIHPEGDERAQLESIRVHARFPMGSPLPTMPPALLAALPPLPAGLEYRMLGTTLILRDVDAAIILDYLPNAVR